jgi:alpha-N-acetylglucosaminidase
MFSTYYLPRWKEFFARLDASLDAKTPFDRAPFAADMCTWEQKWSKGHDTFRTAARGDAVETAVRMYGRYRTEVTTGVEGKP